MRLFNGPWPSSSSEILVKVLVCLISYSFLVVRKTAEMRALLPPHFRPPFLEYSRVILNRHLDSNGPLVEFLNEILYCNLTKDGPRMIMAVTELQEFALLYLFSSQSTSHDHLMIIASITSSCTITIPQFVTFPVIVAWPQWTFSTVSSPKTFRFDAPTESQLSPLSQTLSNFDSERLPPMPNLLGPKARITPGLFAGAFYRSVPISRLQGG